MGRQRAGTAGEAARTSAPHQSAELWEKAARRRIQEGAPDAGRTPRSHPEPWHRVPSAGWSGSSLRRALAQTARAAGLRPCSCRLRVWAFKPGTSSGPSVCAAHAAPGESESPGCQGRGLCLWQVAAARAWRPGEGEQSRRRRRLSGSAGACLGWKLGVWVMCLGVRSPSGGEARGEERVIHKLRPACWARGAEWGRPAGRAAPAAAGRWP